MAEKLHLQISAKDLGSLAMPDFCPRCFWLKRHLKKLPWQIFPSIFMSIDSYTKNVVHAMIDSPTKPEWVTSLGNIAEYIEPPNWRKFQVKGKNTTFTGSPDLMLRMVDGSLQIDDYKTAKFTDNQDKLLPIYETQLNGYAWIAEKLELGPVSGINLIYMEPITDPITASRINNWSADGFSMGFKAIVKPLELKLDSIAPLCNKAYEIFSDPMPDSLPGCNDCHALGNILQAINNENYLKAEREKEKKQKNEECVWISNPGYDGYYIPCKKPEDVELGILFDKDGDRCPYCGKLVKIIKAYKISHVKEGEEKCSN